MRKECLFKSAVFLGATLELRPPVVVGSKTLPEVVFAGRSNVGKSSLINHLLNSKSLAKVSARPGRTRTLNYFNVDGQLIIVDLPGYGYAAQSHEIRYQWSVAVDRYLNKCEALELLVLLIDIRRLPVEADKRLVEWAKYRGKSILLVCTKFDKLREGSEREKLMRIESIANALSVENYIPYSITETTHRKNLVLALNRML